MPLVETTLQTVNHDNSFFGGIPLKVLYADEFRDTHPGDLIYTGTGPLPYLFAGYFSDGEGFAKWFFSNARRHSELQMAIEMDQKKKLEGIFGQLWLSTSALQEGLLQFDSLILQAKEQPVELRDQLLAMIDPSYIHATFHMISSRNHR